MGPDDTESEKKITPCAVLGGRVHGPGRRGRLVVTTGDLIELDDEATTVLISGRADVPRGQIQDDVMALRGTVVIAGTIEDDVLLVDGRVRLEGIVRGDVVVLHGDAILGPQAEIDGDLRTSDPSRSPTAIVRGETGSAGPVDALAIVPRTVWFGLCWRRVCPSWPSR